jgi:hypothetical protein
MARSPGRRVKERTYPEVIKEIEERIEVRQRELDVPQKRIEELPRVRVDSKSRKMAEKLADALQQGVEALDRW